MQPPPFHSRVHQLHVALDGNGPHLFEVWAAQMRAWWNEERPPLGLDPDQRARLLTEARQAIAIHHHNEAA